jgi:uncharacterized protein YdhG (YjbR/CyaY superfamily)
MKSDSTAPRDIDEYLAGFPDEVQTLLRQVRETIAAAAPEATEAIRYGLPTFTLHGNLVHFGAFQKHIGLYAMPSGHAEFARELSAYVCGKGSVRFPIDQPIPHALIGEIVRFRVREQTEKAAARKRKG